MGGGWVGAALRVALETDLSEFCDFTMFCMEQNGFTSNVYLNTPLSGYIIAEPTSFNIIIIQISNSENLFANSIR